MSKPAYGYCQCGCGQLTSLAKSSNKKRGLIKGEPIRYIQYHHIRAGGVHHPNWHGGRQKTGTGYTRIWIGVGKRELEHRINAKNANGGILDPKSIVHHINSKDDNCNVEICKSRSEHAILHVKKNALAACGNEDWRKCHFCHQWDDPCNMTKYASGYYHKKCAAEYVAARRKTKGRKRGPNGRLI